MITYMGVGGYITGDEAWEKGVPWLRPDATEYIKNILPKDARVFEWGMGASTVWFRRLGCMVITCELDYDWLMSVRNKLCTEGLMENIKIEDYSILSPPSLQGYADYVLEYPEESLDLVLVDGRNRCRCLSNARSKVKVGGMLVLDNSERDEYYKAISLLDSWEGKSYGDWNWMTSVWIRPEGHIDEVIFPNEDA